MDIQKLKIEGFEKEFLKLINTYEFKGAYGDKLEGLRVVVKLYQHSTGQFYCRPDVGIRNDNGHPEYTDGYGLSEQEAILDALNDLRSLTYEYYPNIVPQSAFIYRTADEIDEEKEMNDLVPRKMFFDTWEDDKVSKHRKGGPYIEFQLEKDGDYTHWHEKSIFVGHIVFDPVYHLFCKKGNDFNTYGENLFSVSELTILNKKITPYIDVLHSIHTLSEFIDHIAPAASWLNKRKHVVWTELRDAIVDFLREVQQMIDQGIKNKQALFVLGI